MNLNWTSINWVKKKNEAQSVARITQYKSIKWKWTWENNQIIAKVGIFPRCYLLHRERECRRRREKVENMDLLPAETPELAKKHGFRSLKLLTIDMEQPLADKPYGVDYGRLDNGLTYYVRSNSKPKMRAALALVVKAGSVFLSPSFPLQFSTGIILWKWCNVLILLSHCVLLTVFKKCRYFWAVFGMCITL